MNSRAGVRVERGCEDRVREGPASGEKGSEGRREGACLVFRRVLFGRELLGARVVVPRELRFRGGLVFKAHRLLYHSTLGLRIINKNKRGTASQPSV